MKIFVAFDLLLLQIILEPVLIAGKDTGMKKYEGIRDKGLFFENLREESKSLLGLLTFVGELYLQDCSTTIIFYDEFFERRYEDVLKNLFKNLPIACIKRRTKTAISERKSREFLKEFKGCQNYLIFIQDLNKIGDFIEQENDRKVIIISPDSSWAIFTFLKSPVARFYPNLLVIAQSTSKTAKEGSFVLYSKHLYADGIGSSLPVILTSWIKNALTRPGTDLFPQKLKHGFNGHRFRVSASHKPPFAIRRVIPTVDQVQWDGIDIRLIRLLSKVLNFTIDVRDPNAESTLGSVNALVQEISSGRASIAVGGLYRTVDLITRFDTTYPHTYDCASFISLASTALPRYRAVLGPFRPSVWMSLIFAYLGVIIPLTISSRNNLLRAITRPKEIIEMFWFVFSTFTNCFTIRSPFGEEQKSTAILIGLYWVFTIIITSCYTSSIIAFITVPVYPTAMETSDQLLYYRYRIGTLDHDGWECFFEDSDDPRVVKLFKKLELVPTVGEGIKNASRAYFWPYAFLGSQALLEYIVQADFTPGWKTKRSLMHISRECFVQFGITLAFPKGSVYTAVMSKVAQRAYQAGLLQKIRSDVKWDVQRSSSGKLLQVSTEGTLHLPSAEERQLTLADVQGMFMVLGAGILISLLVLLLECIVCKVSKRCEEPSDERDNRIDEKLNCSRITEYEDFPRYPRNSI